MKAQKTIGITGASGALSQALIKIFSSNGYKIIGFTHNKNSKIKNDESSFKLVYWECGKEYLVKDYLKNIDILVLNHGIYESNLSHLDVENSIEINALSNLRLLNLFEDIAFNQENILYPKEVWINTSEAEILPAINPSYEISKSLIGQLVTFKKNFLTKSESEKLFIRKIIIGPFKSELNPIGIMSPNLVAFLIYFIAKVNIFLIIISPNPISYIVFPIKEFYFFIYYQILKFFKRN